MNLALINLLEGDTQAAIDATQRAHVAYQACGDRDLDYSATLGDALALLLHGDYALALETYQSVINRQLEREDETLY